MKIQQAINILEAHNKYRRDNNIPSIYPETDPKKLGIAIDTIVEFHKPKTHKICVKGHDLEKENCVECGKC